MEILRLRERLNEILTEVTHQSLEKVSKDTDRDFIMSSEQAVDYGIIDKVIHQRT